MVKISGGSISYAYSKISMIKDELEEILLDRERFEGEGKEEAEIIKHDISVLIEELLDMKFRLHDLEWLLSGDYGFETYQNYKLDRELGKEKKAFLESKTAI